MGLQIFNRGEAYAPECPTGCGGKMKYVGPMGTMKEYVCKNPKCHQHLYYGGTWNTTRKADRFAEKVSGGQGIEEPGKIQVGV